MSKIGRRPVTIDSSVTITQNGNVLNIKGPKAEFTHELPAELSVEIEGNSLFVKPTVSGRNVNMVWGLNRALLANKISGAAKEFEKKVTLVGLGYKGQLSGSKVVFSLGYSHKVDFEVPKGVTIDIDKTGQNLVVKAADKFVLGNVCDAIRSIRPPEPYKGTGVIREGDVIIRKAGKTKA